MTDVSAPIIIFDIQIMRLCLSLNVGAYSWCLFSLVILFRDAIPGLHVSKSLDTTAGWSQTYGTFQEFFEDRDLDQT